MKIRNVLLAVVAAAGLGMSQGASAASIYVYSGSVSFCGGTCIALGPLFGIEEGSPLTAVYDSASGDIAGVVGTGGVSGLLDWDTAGPEWELHTPGANFPLGPPYSQGLTDDGTNITGGLIAFQNFGDFLVGEDGVPDTDDEALAALMVYIEGGSGLPGIAASWIAYIPGADGSPDTIVASGKGQWAPKVPLPAAVWLLGSGLLGLIGLRRRIA